MWTKNLLEYSHICTENQNKIPVFLQPWWLEAVSGGANWLPYVHLDTPAVWPFFVRRKWGIPYTTLPPLTPRLGWWHPENRTAPQDRPPVSFPLERHHFDLNSGLGAYLLQNGYRLSERGYYHLQAPIDPVAHWNRALNTLSKRQITKAQQQLTLFSLPDAQLLHELMARSLDRHRAGSAAPLAIVQSAVSAALSHQQGAVWAAQDAQGQVHAAVFLVWDQQTVYYIAGGMDERLPQVGGARWLLWKGIEWAAQTGRCFEFGGGNTPGVGRLYASLGGTQLFYGVGVKRWGG